MKINLNSTCQISAKDPHIMAKTAHLYRINRMWNSESMESMRTSECKSMPGGLHVLWKDEDT